LRMRAIQAIGGFPTTSVTEDHLVTVELGRLGWRTVYLNEQLSAGLAPEGMKEYLTQRGRWCLGLMQIVRSPNGPFAWRPMQLAHRIGLIDALIYWGVSFPFKLLCILVPIIYWFTGLRPAEAPVGEAVEYFLPYYLTVMIVLGWATRGMIQPVLTDVSQVLTMFEAIKASAIGLLKPKGQKFKVTAKGGQRDQLFVQWPLLLRFGSLAALTLLGMLYGSYSDFAPARNIVEARELVVWWSIYNLIVLLLAMAVCIELPRYRREERFRTSEPVRVIIEGGDEIIANLSDISLGGAKISAPTPSPLGTTLRLVIQNIGEVEARIVTGSETGFGVEFLNSDEIRDPLVRKLFSSRYGERMRRVRWPRVATATYARLVR
jgi:cellulose synthase (UDP-forming)